ncbi:7TM GPCR Srsx domain containing protein [Trichuris trichiura]|uniref:7TM GPCR Srsx domain containing protein n=1 Tax=Trichuris trichiura TaxID=36087 RepID=A0A077YWG5_TRITR|nr:7TM GPCR Srsx domain containing protein [Trichuris trichiura]
MAAIFMETFKDKLLLLLHCIAVALLTLGFLSIVSSSSVLFMVFKAKALRSRYFMTMIAISINDLLTGMVYFILALYGLLMDGKSENPDSNCCPKSALLSFCNNNALMSAVALSVDRIIAACHPLFYRNVSIYKFHIPLVGLVTSYSLSLSVATVIQGYGKVIPFNKCGPELCWNSTFNVYMMQHLNMALAFSIFFLNLTLVIYTRRSAKTYQRRNLMQLFNIKYREQVRVRKTLTWVTLVVVTLQIAGRTMRLLSLQATNEINYTFLYNSIHIFTALNAVLNYFIVALTSAEFRAAQRRVLLRSSSVGPFRGVE